MKRLNWQSDSQYADLVATGCPTIGALAELRGVPTATVIHRLKAGLAVAAATDASLRRPPIAATKRRSTLLNAHQLAAIESLGFDSVRALSMSCALAEGTIYNRLRRGWTVEAAMGTPPRVTKPLSSEKLAELHELGFTSVGAVARAADCSINQVWDRWVRKNWPIARLLEEPVRTVVAESRNERAIREEAERRTGIRTCVRCRLNAPIGDYRRSAQSSNGRLRVCGSCLSFSIIEDRYGLDREAYDDLWRQQQGRCFGCATDLAASTCRMHVDHDHRTGVVRGLACAFCNWTLGDFRDEPKHLLAAVGWLDANPGIAQVVEGEPQRSPGGDPRGYTLWRDHCMSVDDLRLLLTSQGGRCGICGTTEPDADGSWVVDHHHQGRDAALKAVGADARHPEDARARADAVVLAYRRTVRGVLCAPCNKGLGHAKEDKERMRALAAVLLRSAALTSASSSEPTAAIVQPRTLSKR